MRELAVRLDHRIDVRGVQQRHALGHALVRREHEQAVLTGPGEAFLAHPWHGRQEDVLGEPADIVGMAGEHRAVGRGPADTRHADVAAHDAVHQRRLACPGRADQGHQDRGAGFAQPRQEVVVDLAEQLVPLLPRLLHTGCFQRQRGRDDGLAQREDRRLDEPGVHPDVRLDLLVLGRLLALRPLLALCLLRALRVLLALRLLLVWRLRAARRGLAVPGLAAARWPLFRRPRRRMFRRPGRRMFRRPRR